MQNGRILALVSVIGQDQKGVVARVSTYLAEQGVNIEDIEQKVLQGMFIMNMLVDVTELSCSLDEIIRGLIALGADMKMEIEMRLLSQRRPKRIVVMVSKEDHCLRRLLEDREDNVFAGEIAGIWSNHPDLGPLADKAGVPFRHFDEPDCEKRDDEILAALAQTAPDLVVLARYMQILPPRFVHAWTNRMINIHPSLLPFHKGANAYRQAFEQGRRVAGCTAHFVTEDLDEGPIVLQDVFHIDVGEDTLDDVRRKGQALEANVLSKAVQLFCNNELLVRDGKVVYKPGNDFFKKHHTL